MDVRNLGYTTRRTIKTIIPCIRVPAAAMMDGDLAPIKHQGHSCQSPKRPSRPPRLQNMAVIAFPAGMLSRKGGPLPPHPFIPGILECYQGNHYKDRSIVTMPLCFAFRRISLLSPSLLSITRRSSTQTLVRQDSLEAQTQW